MKIIIFFCVSLMAGIQFAQAEVTLVGNQSPVDFSSLSDQNNHVDFVIQQQALQEIILGETKLFISDLDWNDYAMADYQNIYGNNPQRIILAAFNNTQGEDVAKLNDLSPEALAETFSTRDGTRLLYLYIGQSDSYQVSQDIALFLITDAQQWFEEQGLIAIPDSVYQQNLVTLGVKSPEFVGGYK